MLAVFAVQPISRYISMANYFFQIGRECDGMESHKYAAQMRPSEELLQLEGPKCWARLFEADLRMRIAHTKHEGSEHNVSNGLGANYMTALYGLHSNATLEAFLASHYFSGARACRVVFRSSVSRSPRAPPPESLLLVTELMEESLVVLASRLHWPLEDVLYLTVHDSCVDKETTQFQVYCSKDLRSAVDARQGLVDMIRGLHDRDTRLYSAVRAKLERQFADGGHALTAARTQLHEASSALSALCVPRRQGKCSRRALLSRVSQFDDCDAFRCVERQV